MRRRQALDLATVEAALAALARLNLALELVRRRSPPDVEPAFDRIEREAERLNIMIGELLTLSRLESSQGLERLDFL